MILNDLTQATVTAVYNFYAEVAQITDRQPPRLEVVKTKLAAEAKRFVVIAPPGNPLKPELWYAEDVNKNIIFSFITPTDLSKADLEKAEKAKADFDFKLQQYLVDYYI
jgi:hypothetical protein